MRHHVPGVAPWADWCYGKPSRLLFDSHVVESASGVQQGDPLGPMLFALALQPALEACGCSLDMSFAYLDDVVLAGPATEVARVFGLLERAAHAVGLTVEPSKCELVLAAGSLSEADLTLFPAEFQRNNSHNFELLGAPIGDQLHCTHYTLRERVDKAGACLDALADLPDSQTASAWSSLGASPSTARRGARPPLGSSLEAWDFAAPLSTPRRAT